MTGASVYLSFEQIVKAFYMSMTIKGEDTDIDTEGIPFLHEKLLVIIQNKIDSGEITKDDLHKVMGWSNDD